MPMGMAETARQILWKAYLQCCIAVCHSAATDALALIAAAHHDTAVT